MAASPSSFTMPLFLLTDWVSLAHFPVSLILCVSSLMIGCVSGVTGGWARDSFALWHGHQMEGAHGKGMHLD